MNALQTNERPQIVIVGAGFGGLWAARVFKKAAVDVLLIDRNNYHTFLPLLYQVAAAELDPSQIGYPVRSIFREYDNVDFLMAEVKRIDPDNKLVHTAELAIPYDYLILATGSISTFFGIPGAAQHTFTMKSVEGGIALRNHILRIFEEASHAADPQIRRQKLTFVVIGGGPSGVEYAGALSELIRGPLSKDYQHLDMDAARVILVEGTQRLLGAFSDSLGVYTRARLEDMQIEVRLGALVSSVTAESVTLNDGTTIGTETAVWTAGVGGEGIGKRSGLDLMTNGTLKVQPSLQLPGFDDIYVIGDLAAFEEEDGRFLPMLAPVAMQQGEHAARNIHRQINAETVEDFEYVDKGSMAVIGRNAAVAQIGTHAFTGYLAWLIWLVVHLVQLIGFRNRLFVLLNWAWTYLFFERMVRIIISDKVKEN